MKSAVMNSRIARRNNGELFASALGGLACNIAARAQFRAQESRLCRRGGAVGWNMVGRVARPSAQTEGKGNQQTAKHDRVGPNPEDHGQGTRSWEGEQE